MRQAGKVGLGGAVEKRELGRWEAVRVFMGWPIVWLAFVLGAVVWVGSCVWGWARKAVGGDA